MLTTLLSSGCGTACSLVFPEQGDNRFGGIRYDLEAMGNITGNSPGSSGLLANAGGQGDAVLAVAAMPIPFFDLPLSFIGDLVTYPLVQYLDRNR